MKITLNGRILRGGKNRKLYNQVSQAEYIAERLMEKRARKVKRKISLAHVRWMER